MKLSLETQEKINRLFTDNEELKNKLLAVDADAVREIGSLSQLGINPQDVVEAFEQDDVEKKDYLYNKAKKILELKDLYKELCIEHSKNSINRDTER